MVEIPPDIYFDDGEDHSVDSLPRYDDPCEYLKVARKDLHWVEINIQHGDRYKTIKTKYLDGLDSIFIHQVSNHDEELIVQGRNIDNLWHTVRIYKNSGCDWVVTMNAFHGH